jgi:hypothetical protein
MISPSALRKLSYSSDRGSVQFLAPSAASLPIAKFGFQFAASVGGEQLARLKPMLGSRRREHCGKLPRKLGVLRTSEVPERSRIHRLVKTEDFLDPAIAVGGDDEVLARQRRLDVCNANHHVVMKFALLMVDEQVIGAPVLPNRFEERANHAFGSEFLQEGFCCLHHRRSVARSSYSTMAPPRTHSQHVAPTTRGTLGA